MSLSQFERMRKNRDLAALRGQYASASSQFEKMRVQRDMARIRKELGIGLATVTDQPVEPQLPDPKELHWYGLRARFYFPADPAITLTDKVDAFEKLKPILGNYGRITADNLRHGAVGYKQPLTDQQIYDYELVDLAKKISLASEEDAADIIESALWLLNDETPLTDAVAAELLEKYRQAKGNNKRKTQAVLSRQLRQDPYFVDRKNDPESFAIFEDALALIDEALLSKVLKEMVAKIAAKNATAANAGGETAEPVTQEPQDPPAITLLNEIIAVPVADVKDKSKAQLSTLFASLLQKQDDALNIMEKDETANEEAQALYHQAIRNQVYLRTVAYEYELTEPVI